jgi:HD-GYP domain-containing protein (c-di-GMP phosphodiesterase class II)
MKRDNKGKSSFFLLLITAIIVTLIGMVVTYVGVEQFNHKDRRTDLSEAVYDGEKYVCEDFEIVIGPRGGDTGAWLKDPIYDDAGNELHGNMVGTIYEVVLTNTSKQMITDWTMEMYIPENMWLNNAWNGKMEVVQNVGGKQISQVINLKEYTQEEMVVNHYIDHTGPMITLMPKDRIIYHPSEADNEMPLYAPEPGKEVKTSALIGFIMYLPDRGLEYVTNFSSATIRYHLRMNVWDVPVFMVLLVMLAIWCILLFAWGFSQVRVKKLLEQQKHDAMIIEQSIKTFVNFIDAKDAHTKGHSERVAQYSYLLAKEMGYSELECHRIYYVALMHDCGKISVPFTILQKPTRLTPDEYEVIKTHTTYGDKMLRDFTSIADINLGALYHHERYDGKGYPKGLAGEEIPQIARIIGVADALDAMSSDRYYRKRLSMEKILQELTENKGKQFDPVIVDHVIKLIKEKAIDISDEEEREETTP